jgi:Double zinc ribbon
MPNCPRCSEPVDAQAIRCPNCKTTLKAYGHPGIPLSRATGAAFLCESCVYDADDTCNFPQRPQARECTLYRNIADPLESPIAYKPRPWYKRHPLWFIVGILLLISVVLAIV